MTRQLVRDVRGSGTSRASPQNLSFESFRPALKIQIRGGPTVGQEKNGVGHGIETGHSEWMVALSASPTSLRSSSLLMLLAESGKCQGVGDGGPEEK